MIGALQSHVSTFASALQRDGALTAFALLYGFSQKQIQKRIRKRRDLPSHQMISFHTTKNQLLNRHIHTHLANPYRIIQLHPDTITYRTTSAQIPTETYGGLNQIRSGQWDTESYLTPVDDVWKIKGLKQRFSQELNWEDTVYYDELLSQGKSKPAIESRLFKVEELYQSMSKNGYQPHSTLKEGTEILVAIGRTGEIYLREGHHRYAIASILNEPIYVQVICRHRRWQFLRDRILSGKMQDPEIAAELHPDLRIDID